jgi:hypothetical protein
MEAIKGVIFDRGKKDGKYLALVGMVILSDEPIAHKNEEVIMGGSFLEPISDAINNLKRYNAPHNFGTLDSAIVLASNWKPKDLEKAK